MLDHSCQVQRHPLRDRPGDKYDTPPEAVRALLTVEKLPQKIWEPCAGKGNIVNELRKAGYIVFPSDIEDRGCPGCFVGDFLDPHKIYVDAIVTNPPFYLAERFVETALERSGLVVMLLRLAFYESDKRTEILENGKLARIHAFRKRLPMMHREGWEGRKANSGMAFAWFVWDQAHRGPTTIHRLSWDVV